MSKVKNKNRFIVLFQSFKVRNMDLRDIKHTTSLRRKRNKLSIYLLFNFKFIEKVLF
jgi:hypothetical protein